MSRKRYFPLLIFSEIIEPSPGEFTLLLDVKLNEEEQGIIKWGIDLKTRNGLKRAISEDPLGRQIGENYIHELFLTYSGEYVDGKKLFYGFLECKLKGETKTLMFSCSETFAGNILWFQKIKSFSELTHLVVSRSVDQHSGTNQNTRSS